MTRILNLKQKKNEHRNNRLGQIKSEFQQENQNSKGPCQVSGDLGDTIQASTSLGGPFLFILAMQRDITFSLDDSAPCLNLFFFPVGILIWTSHHPGFLHFNLGFSQMLYGMASQCLLA